MIAGPPAVYQPAASCGLGALGIEITERNLDRHRVALPDGQRWTAQGAMRFLVDCPPQEGRLRLTIWRHLQTSKAHFEWKAVGTQARKNVAGLTSGERFTMAVEAECTRAEKWRIRLYVPAGIAGDGTPTPPETITYPEPARRLECPTVLSAA